jgi:hypothetical protein
VRQHPAKRVAIRPRNRPEHGQDTGKTQVAGPRQVPPSPRFTDRRPPSYGRRVTVDGAGFVQREDAARPTPHRTEMRDRIGGLRAATAKHRRFERFQPCPDRADFAQDFHVGRSEGLLGVLDFFVYRDIHEPLRDGGG